MQGAFPRRFATQQLRFSKAAQGPQKMALVWELGEDGSLVDPTTLIKELGCRVEKTNLQALSPRSPRLSSRLILDPGGAAADFECGQWVRFTPKATASTLDVKAKRQPQNSKELHIMATKGKNMQELLELTNRVRPVEQARKLPRASPP